MSNRSFCLSVYLPQAWQAGSGARRRQTKYGESIIGKRGDREDLIQWIKLGSSQTVAEV
ncbi:MAG TPA: hypothetical protein VMW76_04460 [Bacteroidales bacterium]|nr:hypothetical protein [Bacteroidales bacterium]